MPNELKQHMMEMGLVTREDLQAREVQSTQPVERREPAAFQDPRDANGEVPF